MGKLILYHGSKGIVRVPVYRGGNPSCDYGAGFYTSLEANLAAEWAVAGNTDGYINKYVFDTSGLNILDMDNVGLLYWIGTITHYRNYTHLLENINRTVSYFVQNFCIDTDKYDLIVGNRCDDGYYSIVEMFFNNTLSLEDLSECVKFGALGKQYALMGQGAYEQIQFIDPPQVAEAKAWYGLRRQRNTSAMQQLNALLVKNTKLTRAERKNRVMAEDIALDKLTHSSPEVVQILGDDTNQPLLLR